MQERQRECVVRFGGALANGNGISTLPSLSALRGTRHNRGIRIKAVCPRFHGQGCGPLENSAEGGAAISERANAMWFPATFNQTSVLLILNESAFGC